MKKGDFEMKRITSFEIDHTLLEPGFYISRKDGSITTFDLRTRKPNSGDYMDNVTMHTVEHMFATFARNSDYSDRIVYFGPMGCQTGFYLLTDGIDADEVFDLTRQILDKIITHDGDVFGASEIECGNYKTLDFEKAKEECRKYAKVLADFQRGNYSYKEEK